MGKCIRRWSSLVPVDRKKHEIIDLYSLYAHRFCDRTKKFQSFHSNRTIVRKLDTCGKYHWYISTGIPRVVHATIVT